MKPNAINYLSLARKAGRIEVGEEPAGACARAGHARLMMVAGDAPENTVRRARNFVAGTEQQMVILPFTKDEMGAALGRTAVSLAAMTDPSMALAFLRALEDPKRYGKAIADLENRDQRAKQHREEEKAHERNLRSGKKRQEPAPKPQETPKQEPKEEREYRGPRKENRGEPGRDFRGPRKDFRDGPRKDFRGPKKEFHKGPKTESHGDAKKEFHGEPKREYKKSFSGKPAVPMRKSGIRSSSQQKPAFAGTAGRRSGRKTHGGAE